MTKSNQKLSVQIGRAIAKRRAAVSLTQNQLAEKLGIGQEAVSRIERGLSIPTVTRLAELAEIFGCGIDELLLETSPRVADQSHRLEIMLNKLDAKDREIIIETIERLYRRLA